MPTVAEQQEQKKRRGDAILWTLLFLALLSQVDEQSLVLARSVWTRLAPEAGRDLFDARAVTSETVSEVRVPSRYRFNPDQVRYVAPNGRTVQPAAVKQQAATVAERAQAEARTLTRSMVEGTITVAEWQVQAASLVKAVHLALYVVGRGGTGQMTSADLAAVQSIVEYQLGKLLTYAKGVADGSVSDAKAIERLPLYMASANGSFEQGHGAGWDGLYRRGVKVEVRNVLADGAEHCTAFSHLPGCLEETQRGWVRYGSISTPGQRACLSHCFCRLEYRIAR